MILFTHFDSGKVIYILIDHNEMPICLFHSTGEYLINLILSDNYGCEDTVSKMIEVLQVGVFIPSIFTPNGDGENDFFQVFGSTLCESVCTIYDRWGKIITILPNLAATWDGKNAPEGTYTYLWKGRFCGRKEGVERVGTVIILR